MRRKETASETRKVPADAASATRREDASPPHAEKCESESDKGVCGRVGSGTRSQADATLFGALLNSSPAVIFIKDIEGRYLEVNRRFEEEFGLPRDAVLGRTDPEIFPREQAEMFRANDTAVLQADRPWLLEEVSFQHGQEHIRIVSRFPVRDAAGRTFALCGVVLDVTERRRSDTALPPGEQQLHLQIESTRDYAVIELDTTGRMTTWNADAQRLEGYTAGEILGRHFSCFHPADAVSKGIPDQLLAEALTVGRCEHEGWRIRKDGSRFWAHVIITALRDAGGRHRGFVKLTHDATRRHEVEGALREANAMMQSIFDAAPLAVLSFDLEGRITSWSRGAERLLGWTSAEAVGRVCPPVPEEGREDFLEMVRRVAAHGPEQLVRIRHKKSGERIHALLHPAPLSGPDGTVDKVVMIMQDVTEQHRVEAALRQSEARLNNLIDNALDAIISVDEKHCIQIFNKGAEAMFGYRADEILGLPLERLWPERLVEAHRQHLHRFAVAPETARPMAALRNPFGRRKDGSEFPVEASISKHGADGQRSFTVFLRDITARKRAERQLQDAENLMRQTFASLSDAIFVVDPARRVILQCNPAAERLFGYPAAELIGRDTAHLHVSPQSHAEFGVLSERVLSQGQVFRTEYRMRRKDGTVLLTEHTVNAISDVRGWKGGVVSVVRDVTARKRAEEVLRQSEQQLRALTARLETLREEERTRISREIHDELGQMLTGIKMDLRWIEDRLDDFGDDPRVNPILDKIVATAELTDATARTVQRIAAELRPGVLDKLGLPMALQYEAARIEERTGLPCRVELPGEVPPMRFEAATAFFRIFQEALTNVIRHAGATVVEAELRVEARGCRLEIRDNGRGLGQVELQNPTSLGLRGMQERARLVGGEVSFAVRPDGGTIVAVCIPHHPTAAEGV